MAITFKVTGEENQELEGPQEIEEPKPQATVELVARKTLDGNIVIQDHLDIDIVVLPQKSKIVCFAKKEMSNAVYAVQSKMFEFLRKKGVIIPETIMGGNVYGSLEAKYPAQSETSDPTQAVIFSISKFIEEEKPYFMWDAAHKAEEEERVLEPSEEDTTAYSADLHSPKKGRNVHFPASMYQVY